MYKVGQTITTVSGHELEYAKLLVTEVDNRDELLTCEIVDHEFDEDQIGNEVTVFFEDVQKLSDLSYSPGTITVSPSGKSDMEIALILNLI